MRLGALLCCAFVACGGNESEEEPVDPGPAECGVGERAREDGSCQAAGVPADMPCPPGESLLDDQSCWPAGVQSCPSGFELGGDGGCLALLPAMPCRPGEIALPGETTCRSVASCGNGTWGDIDVSGNTEYVDAAFIGTSTGSATAPWKTIGEAVAAAPTGAVIAVGAGSYPEDVAVTKAVTIWGRCPAMVEVVGQGGELAAFYVRGGANGAKLRGLGVTGSELGVLVTGATDVVLEEMWIHETGFRTVDVENSLGDTSVTIVDSLIEQGVGEGIFHGGARLTIERTVVRASQPEANGFYGRGLGAQALNGERADLTVRTSVFEGNHEAGIAVIGADAVIEDTVVRDTHSAPGDNLSGWGLWLTHDGGSMQRSNTTVRGTLVEASHEYGIVVVGSDATVEGTTVVATLPSPGNLNSGQGVVARNKYVTGDRAVLALNASSIIESRGVGLFVLGGDATVTDTAVLDTLPTDTPTPLAGRGVSVEADPFSNQSSTLVMTSSRVVNHYDQGIFVGGSEVTIDSTIISDIKPFPVSQLFGRGLTVQLDVNLPQFPAKATVRRSLVERVHELGIAVLAAEATIEESTVRDTWPRPDQAGGRGITIQNGPGTTVPSHANLELVLIERATDAGISIFDSSAVADTIVVRDTLQRTLDGLFGDEITVLTLGVAGSGSWLEMSNSHIARSARAGVSNFSARVKLFRSRFDCNALPLAAQQLTSAPAAFEDAGENECSCESESAACKAVTGAIEAPAAL